MGCKSITELMTDFILGLEEEQIPIEVVEHGKMLLLDTFGVAMAAHNIKSIEAIRKAVIEMKTASQCTMWGSRKKVQLADAILYNSALIHGLDFDDTHVGGIVHPSSVVVSTAMSVGEYVGATGKDVFEAIVAGWEIIVRLALAARGGFHDIGYHATGVIGSFAAVCVAGKIMKLSRENILNALGICGSQAAALQEFLHDGTWVKRIHPGWAGHSAIYALFLAKNGLTGPRMVLEGEFGLWKTHLGTIDGLVEEFSNIGSVWHTPEITFKKYQTCHFTHTFIDLILDIKKQYGFSSTDIEKIECRIDSRGSKIVCEPEEAKYRPRTDYIMRFSLPYIVAMTAIKDEMSPKEIDVSYINDPEVLKMIDRVDCIIDDSVANPGHFPGWVKITLKDGREYQKEQPYEPGTIQNPIEMKDIELKFYSNTNNILSKKKAKEILESIKQFQSLKNVTQLTDKMLMC